MREHKQKQSNEPWDYGVYETGRTQPPKNHSSTVTVLLVIVIFLGGLVSALGVMNVRLFFKLNDKTQETDPVSFFETDTSTEPDFREFADLTPAIKMEENKESFDLQPIPEPQESMPQEGGLSFQDIYDQTIESVVSVSCAIPEGTSSGTGVILSSAGHIVTNAHVVENAQSITIRLTDERKLPATVVGMDAISDLAVLHVDAQDLIPARFGNSDQMRVGDTVVAIGDPLGEELRGTMTNGIVSAINRDVKSHGRTMTLIQTNAALNSGNSGGPLINCYGQVIGINTMKIGTFVDAAGVEGIGFAIPSTTVKEIVDQLIDQGFVSGRPSMGVSGKMLTLFYQRYYRLPPGFYIMEVMENSGAAEAGLETRDILIAMDGTEILSLEDLDGVLYSHEVGDVVRIVIYRNGEYKELSLTLTEGKAN